MRDGGITGLTALATLRNENSPKRLIHKNGALAMLWFVVFTALGAWSLVGLVTNSFFGAIAIAWISIYSGFLGMGIGFLATFALSKFINFTRWLVGLPRTEQEREEFAFYTSKPRV
jgi:hypothetical protein